MKTQKGITLLALTIYIAVTTIVVGAMSYLSTSFYQNLNIIKEQGTHSSEFNKLNMFMVSDAKNNNKVTVEEEKIEFENGDKYEYKPEEQKIYRNNTVIAEQVKKAKFTLIETKINNTNKQIVQLDLQIGEKNTFQKEMRYVLKYW